MVKPEETKQIDWATAPGGPPEGKHLIGPSEFEADEGAATADGWSTKDGQPHPEIFAVDRSVRYVGQSSQRITPNGSDINHVWSISNYHTPETGKRYRVQVWCKTDSAKGTVRAIGRFVSNAMEFAGEFETKPVLEGNNGWTLLSGVGVAPEFGRLKENSGRLQVLVEADLAEGSAWFDTIWVGEDDGIDRPPALKDFEAQGGKFNAMLSWRVPEGAKSVKIVYKSGSYPTGPEDGKLVDAGSGTNILTVENLHPSSRWYFAAYSVAPDGTLSFPTYASAQPRL